MAQPFNTLEPVCFRDPPRGPVHLVRESTIVRLACSKELLAEDRKGLPAHDLRAENYETSASGLRCDNRDRKRVEDSRAAASAIECLEVVRPPRCHSLAGSRC